MTQIKICLFHKDLRLDDNPAFLAAIASGAPVIPVYVYDHTDKQPLPLGSAQKWWLHQSLKSLDNSLKERGSQLILRTGSVCEVVRDLCEKFNITEIYWNHAYTKYEISQYELLETYCSSHQIKSQQYCGTLLFEPWNMCKADGTPYKVYTAFKNYFLSKAHEIKEPRSCPQHLPACPETGSLSLEDLKLLPAPDNWSNKLDKHWKPGESTAFMNLEKFIDEHIETYHENRDFPAVEGTSKLSPYLQMGEISPRRVWYLVQKAKQTSAIQVKGIDIYLSELIWREFAYHILYHYPDLATQNYRKEFNKFPWHKNEAHFEAWCKGLTGFPIVDAGMRQLWETGWMHNRVRMIVASFLTKDLLIDWREGEKWFWDTLVDADAAINPFNWQWVAGSGVDAAPYFRIFNPSMQQEKFDRDNIYIKRWLIDHKMNSPIILLDGGESLITENVIYHVSPVIKPIIDHAAARRTALSYYKKL